PHLAPTASTPPVSGEPVEDILVRHRVEPRLVERLARTMATIAAEEPTLTIAAGLDSLFRFSVLEDQPRRPLLFLGFPGAGTTAAAAPVSGDPAADILVRHRVEPRLVERLARTMATIAAEEPTLTIAAGLDSLFRFSVLEDQPRRPLLFLGFPGAGKTAAIAKL